MKKLLKIVVLGFTQLCASGHAKTGPEKWRRRQDHLKQAGDIMSDRDSGNRNVDRRREEYYGHSNKNCEMDLRKSAYLEPTEEDFQLQPRSKSCKLTRWQPKYNHQRSLDCLARLEF